MGSDVLFAVVYSGIRWRALGLNQQVVRPLQELRQGYGLADGIHLVGFKRLYITELPQVCIGYPGLRRVPWTG